MENTQLVCESGDSKQVLTEERLEELKQQLLSRDISHPSYAEISRQWEGVREFNKEAVFNVDPALRKRNRWSNTSSEYSDYFARADRAAAVATSHCQDALKQYTHKTFQCTASPHERWDTGTEGWPDRALDLANNTPKVDSEAAVNNVAMPNEGSASPAEINSLDLPQHPIEVDYGREDNEFSAEHLIQIEMAKKQRQRIKPATSRTQRHTKFRVKKRDTPHQ